MPGDTTLQASGFRLRRTHEKSRNGCVRCKQQRKKCDELKPSCSRCTKRMYKCRYYHNDASDSNLSEQDATHLPVPDSHVSPNGPNAVAPGSGSPSPISSRGLSLPTPPSGGGPPSASSLGTGVESLVLDCHSSSNLDAIELSLLAHYLTHTSQTIPIDDLDLYSLSVGVPNLALKSQAVMSSLLALAAACKSHDIAKEAQTLLDHRSLMQIQGLLTLAERHHRASLRHIQEAMHDADSDDYVLANSALMVLYASANHSIRVHLATTAKHSALQLPDEVLPQHSQWISFTRAAHTASTAVLSHIMEAAENIPGASTHPATDTGSDIQTRGLCPTSVLSPQEGPSENTKRLFLPLVVSTYSRALASLRRRAESTAAILQRSGPSTRNDAQLQASLDTLPVLEQCASLALSTTGSSRGLNVPRNQPRAFDRLSRVSLWVARYMISVTSMESPWALRRIIMSFLNKAPTEYLNLVRSVLDSTTEARSGPWTPQGSPGTETPSLHATHFLAMDIFAHWLVLVMLLDGVWWIGDIGQWELSQLMPLMKAPNVLGWSVDARETWWPESMYLVKRELTPNV
ncbi:hypothetical protein BDV26DRAFT_255752 [Aspergillus bertholletiae]|uniref:Zn(2)-C6 fungal-type domain-containing protein n=1 Tax=Aspergillus bertholletiae TaxID=1226010 RepID=A0A5N7BHR8_9EURO|nr:hypothetical protein BDV26DRAFT_255752 [Aspergillus bertholletiae]